MYNIDCYHVIYDITNVHRRYCLVLIACIIKHVYVISLIITSYVYIIMFYILCLLIS